MKRITLSLPALCLTAFLYAQPFPISQGNFLGGGKGKLSFTSQKYLNDQKLKDTKVHLRPDFGYFPIDNWAIGANLNFESTKSKIDDQEIDKSNDVGAGIWSRYYILPKTHRMNVFGEAGFNFGGSKFDDDDRISYNSFNLGVSMAYFVNSFIAFELGVEYASKKWEDEDERINRVALCGGFQMHFGPCTKKK